MGSKKNPLDDTLANTTLTMELRRKKRGQRFTLPTIRVVAGADMLRFCSVYPDERVTIGRDDRCDLTLVDASVSRKHAAIAAVGKEKLVLEDLGSTNGTTHNGKPVTGSVEVRVGDHIDVGGVTLRIDRMGLDELAHLARVVERLTLANKDALTGLVTRLYLNDELPDLIARHQISEVPLSAVFLDLDHFKNINDTHGHGVGDEVLRAAGRLMALSVRDSDTCVRYGGEEFLAVLPSCDEHGAYLMAERLRQQVARHDWGHYAKGLQVTASLGVASHEGTEEMGAWLERADKALYAAKRAGRNRTVRWSQLAEEGG